jgi:response regulator NasT
MTQTLGVAVADDEPDAREYFERCLPRLGHQVVASAENGRQILELCREARPDLIITDVKMPGMTGLEAVSALFLEQAMPVVVATGHADPEWVEQARAVGAFGYLLKPVTEKNLGPAVALELGPPPRETSRVCMIASARRSPADDTGLKTPFARTGATPRTEAKP